MRLALHGGAYSPRALIADAQRCVNLYPELNRVGSAVQVTHLQRPGLRVLAEPSAPAPGRCLYTASNGQLYAVIGSTVYSVDSSWNLTSLGSITPARGNVCSMADQGTYVLLVDGTSSGWTIDMGTQAFATVLDPVFPGADRVDSIDTYIVGNEPGTRNWWSTLSAANATPINSLQWDSAYFGQKVGWPDPIGSLLVNRLQVLVLGAKRGEIWNNAGNPQFPFSRLAGTYIEHGIAAPYSIASSDISTFWLEQSMPGQGTVMRQRGYETLRVSNHAIEYAIRRIAQSQGISDATGYTYQCDGHWFYVLTFPAGNQTWVFDDAMIDPLYAWHQRAWTDANGNLGRERPSVAAFAYGQNVALDYTNGTLYALDPECYTDTVGSVEGPITYLRTFGHTMELPGPEGPMSTDGHRTQNSIFTADIQCGDLPLNPDGTSPQAWLRWSTTRGRTWGTEVLQTLGAPGAYDTMPTWQIGGVIARDLVFELGWSCAGEAPLNGAWIKPVLLGS